MADEIVTLLKYKDYHDKKACCFCGVENISTASKCYLCGADLTKPEDTLNSNNRDCTEKNSESKESKTKTLRWIVATAIVAIIIFAILGYNYIVVPNNILVGSKQEALMYNGTLLYTVSSYDERIYNVLNECDIYADALLDSNTYDDYKSEEMYIRKYTIKVNAEISEVVLSGKNVAASCEINRLDKIENAQIQDGYYNMLNKASLKNIAYDVRDVSLNFENQKWRIKKLDNGFFRISKFNDENTALSCSDGGLSDGETLAKEFLTVATKKNNNSQFWKFIKSYDGYYIVSAKNEDMFLSCDSSGEVYLASWEFVDENYLWTLGKIEGYERYVEWDWSTTPPNNAASQSCIFKETQNNCVKISFGYEYADDESANGYPFGDNAQVMIKVDGKWKKYKTFVTPSQTETEVLVEIEFDRPVSVSELQVINDNTGGYHYWYRITNINAHVI